MKISLKKILNLNSYQWWKNHRRLVTIGIFLSLFGFYFRAPFVRDFKVKDTCARLNSSFQITGLEAMNNLNLEEIQDYDNRAISNNYCERYLGIK